AAASNCMYAGYGSDMNRFAGCWVMQMASDQQREIANCVMMNTDWASAGFCMAGRNLNPMGQAIARCALYSARNPQLAAPCPIGPMGGRSRSIGRLGGRGTGQFLGPGRVP